MAKIAFTSVRSISSVTTEVDSTGDPITPPNLLVTESFVPKAVGSEATIVIASAPENVPTRQPPAQLAALTGLRAWLAAWVVMRHVLWGSERTRFFGVYTGDLRFLVESFVAVDAFYMLSGFILCYVYCYREKFSFYKFLSARFARIVPLHWTCLLLLIGLQYLFQATIPGVALSPLGPMSDFPKNFFLVQAWSFKETTGFNDVAWSVSAEAFAYCLFPVYMLCCVLSPLWCALPLGAASVLAVLWITSVGKADSFNTLWRIIPEFSLGAILYRAYRYMSTLPKCYIPPFTGGIIVVAVGVLLEFTNRFDIAVLLLGILLLVLALEKDWLCKILSNRFFVYAGNVSYAFYLLQRIVERFFQAGRSAHPNFFLQATHWRLSQYLQFVTYLVLLTGLACLFHHGVENPARRYITTLSERVRDYWQERRSREHVSATCEMLPSGRKLHTIEQAHVSAERVDNLPHVTLQVGDY